MLAQLSNCKVFWVAAEAFARVLAEDSVLTCIAPRKPKCNTRCGLTFCAVERGREIGNRLCFVLLDGTKPFPALIFSTDIHLFPEPFDLPVPAEVKIDDVDAAAAFFDFPHAIQALTHDPKVAFVGGFTVAVPRAF